RVAVGVLDHRRALDLARAHIASGRRQLSVPGHPREADVTGRCHLDLYGLIEADLSGAALQLATPERTGAAKPTGGRVAAQVRAGGKLDVDVDRAAIAERAQLPQPARCLDQ